MSDKTTRRDSIASGPRRGGGRVGGRTTGAAVIGASRRRQGLPANKPMRPPCPIPWTWPIGRILPSAR